MKQSKVNISLNRLFIITANWGLIISGPVMAFSGLIIQCFYHIGNHGTIDHKSMALGLSYTEWTDIHKISIIILSIFVIIHIRLHWTWYRAVMKNRAVKNIQVIILTVIFIVVSVTGFIPWAIHMAGGSDIIRRNYIEVHDKVAIILGIYLFLHIKKRFKWYRRFRFISKSNS